MNTSGRVLVAAAVLALSGCGGQSFRETGGSGANAGTSGEGAAAGSNAAGGTGGSAGGTGGAGGSASVDCSQCPRGTFCTKERTCLPFACDLATEACGAPRCENGEGACSVTWGPLEVLPTAGTEGICHRPGELFVIESEPSVVSRFTWPELAPTTRSVIAPGLGGDCAVVGASLYYPGRGSIDELDLASDEITQHYTTPRTRTRAVTADEGTLWTSVDEAEELTRTSLDGQVLASLPNRATTNECDALEATPTGLWCVDLASKVLFKLSKEDGSLLAGPFFSQPTFSLALIDGELWAADDGFVYDPLGGLTGQDVRVEGLRRLILDGVAP